MKDSFNLEPVNGQQIQQRRPPLISPLYLWAEFKRYGLDPNETEDIDRLVYVIYLLQALKVDHGYNFRLNPSTGFYSCPELEFDVKAAIQEFQGKNKPTIATYMNDIGFDETGNFIKNPNYIRQ